MERAARATRPRRWREAAGAHLRVGRAKEKEKTGTTRRSMEVSSIAVATGVDTIGAAGRPPAADGACWWDGGVGRAFDEGAVAPRMPIRASVL